MTVRLCPLPRRLFAYIIDLLLMNIFFGQLMQFVYGDAYLQWMQQSLMAMAQGTQPPAPISDYLLLWTFAVPVGYCSFFWVLLGAMPAQYFFKIRVLCSTTLLKLAPHQAALRALVLLVMALLIVMVPIFGFVLIAPLIVWQTKRHPQQQAWHDLLAKSVVVLADSIGTSASQPPPSGQNHDSIEF